MNLAKEIALVLVVKLLLIFWLKWTFFSDPVDVDAFSDSEQNSDFFDRKNLSEK